MFVLKLIVVLQLKDHPLLQPDSGLDTSAYVALAARVRAGDLLLGPGLYFVSPLYIYFLAAALTVCGSFTAVRVIQIALGSAAVGLVFVAAREWFGTRAAWLAAIAAALTGPFSFYEALLLQSALDPALTAGALAALALGLRREPRRGWLVAAGLAFGIQTLNRPNTIAAAIAVVIVAIAVRRFRDATLVGAGIAIALAPVLIRNVAIARVWSPLPSHGGLNFYIGNNPDADGVYHSVPGITPNIAGQEADARRVASNALGKPASDPEASAYFRRRAIDWIRAHPGDAAQLFARKLGYTFNAAHLPLNDSYAFYADDQRTLLAILFVGAWILIPLGISGLILAAPRDRPSAYVVWASFVPAYAVSVAIFFVSDRYRLPLLVPLCVGAGAAADRAFGWVGRHWRTRVSDSRAVTAVVVGAILFVVVNRPVHLDDGRIEERTRMAEQSAAEGRVDDADRWAARAEAANPQPALVDFRVGRALLASRHVDAAVRHLERAAQLDPGRPETEYALGQALLDAGRAHDAVPHLRIAFAAGVRPDVSGFDLARALTASGDRNAATAVLRRLAPVNSGDAASWTALGELAVQLAAPDLEERFFSRAVGADPANPTPHLNLAVAYAQEGRISEARDHARQALKLKPDYEKARQLLTALEAEQDHRRARRDR